MLLEIVHNLKVSGRKANIEVVQNVKNFYYNGNKRLVIIFKSKEKCGVYFDPNTDMLNIF